jgi:hypothetical protein
LDEREILPPGQHPRDSRRPDTDQIGHALERLQTFLIWIDEHRASFEKGRATDPQSAEAELRDLQDSTEQAVLHLERLRELLLAGYTIGPAKKSPKGLCNPAWARWGRLLDEKRRP